MNLIQMEKKIAFSYSLVKTRVLACHVFSIVSQKLGMQLTCTIYGNCVINFFCNILQIYP